MTSDTSLPPIYARLTSGGELDTLDDGEGIDYETEAALCYVREADAKLYGAAVAKYEPAVPRCATCPKFTKDWDEDSNERSWYYCPELESDEPFPQDGSGYCHMHPEASRG